MFGHEVLDRVVAERAAAAGRKQRVLELATAFLQPDAQRVHGGAGQRCAAVFTALAVLCRSAGNAESGLPLTSLLVLWLLCAF
jgi:hypothetical protein